MNRFKFLAQEGYIRKVFLLLFISYGLHTHAGNYTYDTVYSNQFNTCTDSNSLDIYTCNSWYNQFSKYIPYEFTLGWGTLSHSLDNKLQLFGKNDLDLIGPPDVIGARDLIVEKGKQYHLSFTISDLIDPTSMYAALLDKSILRNTDDLNTAMINAAFCYTDTSIMLDFLAPNDSLVFALIVNSNWDEPDTLSSSFKLDDLVLQEDSISTNANYISDFSSGTDGWSSILNSTPDSLYAKEWLLIMGSSEIIDGQVKVNPTINRFPGDTLPHNIGCFARDYEIIPNKRYSFSYDLSFADTSFNNDTLNTWGVLVFNTDSLRAGLNRNSPLISIALTKSVCLRDSHNKHLTADFNTNGDSITVLLFANSPDTTLQSAYFVDNAILTLKDIYDPIAHSVMDSYDFSSDPLGNFSNVIHLTEGILTFGRLTWDDSDKIITLSKSDSSGLLTTALTTELVEPENQFFKISFDLDANIEDSLHGALYIVNEKLSRDSFEDSKVVFADSIYTLGHKAFTYPSTGNDSVTALLILKLKDSTVVYTIDNYTIETVDSFQYTQISRDDFDTLVAWRNSWIYVSDTSIYQEHEFGKIKWISSIPGIKLSGRKSYTFPGDLYESLAFKSFTIDSASSYRVKAVLKDPTENLSSTTFYVLNTDSLNTNGLTSLDSAITSLIVHGDSSFTFNFSSGANTHITILMHSQFLDYLGSVVVDTIHLEKVESLQDTVLTQTFDDSITPWRNSLIYSIDTLPLQAGMIEYQDSTKRLKVTQTDFNLRVNDILIKSWYGAAATDMHLAPNTHYRFKFNLQSSSNIKLDHCLTGGALFRTEDLQNDGLFNSTPVKKIAFMNNGDIVSDTFTISSDTLLTFMAYIASPQPNDLYYNANAQTDPGYFYLDNVYVEKVSEISNSNVSDINYTSRLSDDDIDNKTTNTSKAIGVVAGSHSVDGMGALNYSIPIYIPEGINGMAPNVSINYNSQAPNGLLGFGWNLSANSSITYDTKDEYHDGKSDLNYINTGNPFILDGQRLVVTSGSNGQNNAVYSTEQESFSKITSFGSSGSCSTCPDHFTVQTKSGMIMEYGNTPDSKLSTAEGLPIRWYVDKSTDPTGNYIQYYYATINNEKVLDRIEYTKNDAVPTIVPNVIQFNYSDEPRTDKNVSYAIEYNTENANTPIYKNNLLMSIDCKAEGSGTADVVKHYDFIYSTDNLYTYLNEVKETSGSEELNTTAFKYGLASDTISLQLRTRINVPPTGLGKKRYYGDFNGDGTLDICIVDYTNTSSPFMDFYLYDTNADSSYVLSMHYMLPTSETLTIPDENGGYSYTYPLVSSFAVGDIDGDGKDEMLVGKKTGKTGLIKETYGIGFDVYKLYSASSEYTPPTYKPVRGKNFFYTGDFDGDGKTDIYCGGYIYFVAKGTTYNSYMDPDGNGEPSEDDFYSLTDSIVTKDITGDGTEDLILYRKSKVSSTNKRVISYYKIQFQVSPSYTYEYVQINADSITSNTRDFFVGDFNGDTRNDKIEVSTDSLSLYLSDNKTYNLVNTIEIPEDVDYSKVDSNKEAILVGDYNGDGKDDVLHYYIPSGSSIAKYAIYYSNGINFKRIVYDAPSEVKDYLPVIANDFNSDGNIDIQVDSINNTLTRSKIVYINYLSQDRLLTKIKDGYERTTSILYSLYSNHREGRIYSLNRKDFTNTHSFLYTPSGYGVYKVTTPNLSGDFSKTASITYKYYNAVGHTVKGSLGMMSMTSLNSLNGAQTITTQSLIDTGGIQLLVPTITNSQFPGGYSTNQMVLDSIFYDEWNGNERNSHGFAGIIDTLWKTVNTTYSIQNQSKYLVTLYSNKRFWLKQISASSDNTILDSHSNTTFQYDAYGNITNKIDTIRGGSNVIQTSSTSVNQFLSNGSYIPYLPDKVTSTTAYRSAAAYTTQVDNDYNSKGQIIQTISFKNAPSSKQIITTYQYDSCGNTLKQTITPYGLTPRYTRYEYMPNERTLYKSYKSMPTGEQCTQIVVAYDKKYNLPLVIQNGLYTNQQTVNTYDDWGKITSSASQVNGANTIVANNTYSWDGGTFYKVETTKTSSPPVTTYFDRLDKTVKTSTQNFSGDDVVTTYTYDSLGNVKTTEMPDAAGGTNTITYTYGGSSDYFRLLSVADNFSTSSYTYYSPTNGGENKVRVTKSSGAYKEKTTDAAGFLLYSTDDGGTLTFNYNSLGKMTNINLGSTTGINTMAYDDVTGMQTQISDKNSGTTNFRYDNWGQLVWQKNGAGFEDTLTYDAIGRLIKKERKTKGNIPGEIIEYLYESGAGVNGQEQLGRVLMNGKVQEGISYDDRHRPIADTTYINDTAYITSTAYNNDNSISSVTYPQNFTINYSYNSLGYSDKVKFGDKVLCQTNSTNLLNQPLSYTLGNDKTSTITYQSDGMPSNYSTVLSGSTYIQNLDMSFNSTTGNLISRTDKTKGSSPYSATSEAFTYNDKRDQLSTSTIGSNIDSIVYASNGNITKKSKVGTYTYGSKINAVSNISAACGSINPLDSFLNVIQYTPFNQPDTIRQSNLELSFTYGPDHQRSKMIFKKNGTLMSTRYYVGNYEKFIDSAGTTRHIYYINGSNGLCCIAINTGGTTNFYYVYKDHLGSILKMTDSTGYVIGEQSFDPWGRERNPNDWSKDTITQPVGSPFGSVSIRYGLGNNFGWMDRGYTGHEQLRQFNLVNMNGRLYDPIVGRMLSPDNNVADAGNSQAYNKYSYVSNNPLKYTDPSGWKFIHPQQTLKQLDPDAMESHGGGGGGGRDFSIFGYSETSAGFGYAISGFSNLSNQFGMSNALAMINTGSYTSLLNTMAENAQKEAENLYLKKLKIQAIIDLFNFANAKPKNTNNKSFNDIRIDWAAAGTKANSYSDNIFNFPDPNQDGDGKKNAFRHLFGDAKLFILGYDESAIKSLENLHEIQETFRNIFDPNDKLIDKNNNVLGNILGARLASTNRNYSDNDLAIETIKFMHSDGYWITSPNGINKGSPDHFYLTINAMEGYIKNVNDYKSKNP